MTEDQAWDIYHLIEDWKNGSYGDVSLQEVLDERESHLKSLPSEVPDLHREDELKKVLKEVSAIRTTAEGRKVTGGWYYVNWFKYGWQRADQSMFLRVKHRLDLVDDFSDLNNAENYSKFINGLKFIMLN